MPIARGLMERSQPISSRQPASLLATLRRCPSGKVAASSLSLETSIPTVGSICAISSVPALWCELLALATVRVHEEETARAHAHPRIGTLVGYVLRAGPGDRVDTDLPATTLWHLLKTQGGGKPTVNLYAGWYKLPANCVTAAPASLNTWAQSPLRCWRKMRIAGYHGLSARPLNQR